MKKLQNILLLTIFSFFMLSSIIMPVFASETEPMQTSSQVKLEKYSNTINIVYWILIAIFFLASIITIMMVNQHYGSKHLLRIILFIIAILILGFQFILELF